MYSHKPLLSVVTILMVLLSLPWNVVYATCTPSGGNRPVCPASVDLEQASFIDPTAVLSFPTNVRIGAHSYVAPFADLLTPKIVIGEKTNLQDSVMLAGTGTVTLGDETILAHGARVDGPAKVGRSAVAGEHNASFIGFNSYIRGATVEHDAMVLHLARVNPGLVIKHGKVVLSGKDITTQAQADDPALGKVIPITDALRLFMEGVLHVNETFAKEYTRLYRDGSSNVTGINYDPGDGGASPTFNPTRDLPILAGASTREPAYRNRFIGGLSMSDSYARLNGMMVVGNKISLRTDEGEPFHVGTIARMNDRTTFHALEHTGIDAHNNITYGLRSLVHGGQSAATVNNAHSNTVIGDGARIGNYAVLFRSVTGANVNIGCASLVDGSTLPAGTVIPARTIVINRGHAGATTYPVEWNPGCAAMGGMGMGG